MNSIWLKKNDKNVMLFVMHYFINEKVICNVIKIIVGNSNVIKIKIFKVTSNVISLLFKSNLHNTVQKILSRIKYKYMVVTTEVPILILISPSLT